MNKGVKIKNGFDVGQCDIINLTTLSRNPKQQLNWKFWVKNKKVT